MSERRSGADQAAHARRLREEIRISQEKFKKLQQSYALLLSRKDSDVHRKQYEEMQARYERERAVWAERRERMQRELEERSEQCRRLEAQLVLQQDVAELKARLARLQS
jgi:hypothetical protein